MEVKLEKFRFVFFLILGGICLICALLLITLTAFNLIEINIVVLVLPMLALACGFKCYKSHSLIKEYNQSDLLKKEQDVFEAGIRNQLREEILKELEEQETNGNSPGNGNE